MPTRADFKETLKLAIERSPTLASVRTEVDVRNLEYRNSYSVLLPSLDLSSTIGLTDSRPQAYASRLANDFNLFLTENLYDNGASLTNWDSAKIRREIADLNFRAERDRTLLAVAQEYMRYSLAKSLLEVQGRQFSIVNQQFRSVESQFQLGVKTRRGYLKFKTELRRSEIQVQNAEASAEKSRLELMKLIGFDSKDSEPYNFVPIAIVPGDVASVPRAQPDVSGHYRYRIADLQKQVLENDVQIVRRKVWPELYLTAGATYHQGDYLGTNVVTPEANVTSMSVLLNLKFNIWDWGIRRRNVSIAEARKSQAEFILSDGLNNFSSENSQLMLDLKMSANNYNLARELLELESQSYGYLETDYRNGRVSYLDIVVSLRDLLNAKVQMQSSYFDLRAQLLKYRFYEGRLYESLFEE